MIEIGQVWEDQDPRVVMPRFTIVGFHYDRKRVVVLREGQGGKRPYRSMISIRRLRQPSKYRRVEDA